MRTLCLLLIFLLLCGCSTVETPPEIHPLKPLAAPLSCTFFFPKGDWQYVHAIDFKLASGKGGSAIGVLVLTQQDIRCALTTVEGLTLFEARAKANGPVEILRALPPFDKEGFAENLIRDIRTLFIPPLGLVRQGQMADGAKVCRYVTAEGSTADLMATADGCWRMQTYNADSQQNRSVRSYSCEWTPQSGLMPGLLVLKAPGATGYSITMRLITAHRLIPGT